jgi:hypothetical protein
MMKVPFWRKQNRPTPTFGSGIVKDFGEGSIWREDVWYHFFQIRNMYESGRSTYIFVEANLRSRRYEYSTLGTVAEVIIAKIAYDISKTNLQQAKITCPPMWL